MQVSPEYWFLGALLSALVVAFLALRRQTNIALDGDVAELKRNIKRQEEQIEILLEKMVEMRLELATLRVSLENEKRSNQQLTDAVAAYQTRLERLGFPEK